MVDPWKEDQKRQKDRAPRFYLSIINCLLIVLLILIGLYLWKSSQYNELKEKNTNIEEKLAIKDKEMQQSVSEAELQKAVAIKDAAKLPTVENELYKLSLKLLELNRSMLALEEGQRAVKYACISSTECRDIYLNLTINVFLTGKSLQTNLVSMEKGLDYHQYFLAPVETGNFTFTELGFIKQNCANKWYEIPGLYVTRYTMRLITDSNKRIQIIMNDKSADILCAWLIDDPTNNYTIIA